ncbi:MAG: hypothetical protein IKH30_01600 [Clostridia bacterium]|nr:hypothetical protein [Clostridia bacterium]MBR4537231.1 hypothetical protein [Clostridia bacterium]
MGRLIVGLVLALCALAAFGAGFVAGMLHMRKNYREELRHARRLTRAAIRHEGFEG